MKNTFKKSERLTSKIAMETIFAEGNTVKKFPLILKYVAYQFEDNAQLKVVVSVPKRRIRKATDRNKVRRKIKEAYRLHKNEIKTELTKQGRSLALFLIYTGKENPDYLIIENKIKLLLKELIKLPDTNQ